MRALSVQRRMIWTPDTPAENTTLLPIDDPRVPPGLPAHVKQIRCKTGRDSYIVGRPQFPIVSTSTIVTYGTWAIHDPNCPAENDHGFLRPLTVSGSPSNWLTIRPNLFLVDRWTYFSSSMIMIGAETAGAYFASTTWNPLCQWFLADDWITLTP